MEFEQWWAKNKDLYNLVNVKKEIAKAIWDDATFAVEAKIHAEISQILEES